MSADAFIAEALERRPDAIFYQMTQALRGHFPDYFLLETESSYFQIVNYASAGQCQLTEKPDMFAELDWDWSPTFEEYRFPYNGWFEVEWRGRRFDLVMVGRQESHCRTLRSYLVAEDEADVRALFREVCRWNAEVRGEVLVFEGGQWAKSSVLHDSIQSASFDNLILEGDLSSELKADVRSFFEAKDLYGKYGIAWKRGILLLGPPGNGKTHAVKALVNALDVPCLYVKSFSAEYVSDQGNIGQVFARARESAPCILVLEDLDALINSGNRAFFLNEMDGFASNDGILTLATTNHPERLDPAILERPSRFDRKYTFNLPAVEERVRYLQLFSAGLQSELRLGDQPLRVVADATEGYSFAYLKELYLSAMMRWIADPGASPIERHMVEQSASLRSQMASSEEAESGAAGDEGELEDLGKSFQMVARRHRFRLPQ